MNEQRRTTLPQLTDRIPLLRMLVSPFCIGMVEHPDTIAAAFDAGINFFFVSADMHWPRYEAARIGLERLLARVPREQVVVAAAAYVTQPEFCRWPFHEVVQAVPGLGQLDVLVAGGAYGTELSARLPVYRQHREQQLAGARAIGVSFHDRKAAAATIASGEIEIAFIRYNAGHPGAQRDVFPALPEPRHTRVFGFTSTAAHHAVPTELAEALWVPEITDHYRFALSRVGLDGLLCSPSQPSHIPALAEAMARGPLSLEEEEHMIELASRQPADRDHRVTNARSIGPDS
jgi:hypothetical protein